MIQGEKTMIKNLYYLKINNKMYSFKRNDEGGEGGSVLVVASTKSMPLTTTITI